MKLSGNNASPSFGKVFVKINGEKNHQNKVMEGLQPFLLEKGCKITTGTILSIGRMSEPKYTYAIKGKTADQEDQIAEVLESKGFFISRDNLISSEKFQATIGKMIDSIKQRLSDI